MRSARSKNQWAEPAGPQEQQHLRNKSLGEGVTAPLPNPAQVSVQNGTTTILASSAQPRTGMSRILHQYRIQQKCFMVGCALILFVLSIVCLSLPNWVSYCSFNAGLTGYSGDVGTTMSYSDAKDTCSVISLVSDCGNYCTDTKMLQAAGVIMAIGGAIAIVIVFTIGGYRVLMIVKPRCYKRRVFGLQLFLANVLWLFGTTLFVIVYILIADTSIKPASGLVLAVVVQILYILTALQGLIIEKKAKIDFSQEVT